MKKLLMGNEAIALGAIQAGVTVFTGYPGTPSTEILETVVRERGEQSGIYVEWSVNEKTALEVAAGAAVSGRRAMVTMKQVGLNVASDPLMNLNYLGVSGALVVVVADDPGPISSQTEQDSRHFGVYSKIAVFDPSSPAEAYAMAVYAFDFSEKYGRPVILRPTTRVCHSYASVELPAVRTVQAPATGFQKAGGRWVIFPPLAYRNHIQIEADLVKMAAELSLYPGNRIIEAVPGGTGAPVRGIAAGGVSWAYVREALGIREEGRSGIPPVPVRLLKAATLPFPSDLALEFLRGLEEALVVEELDPVIERELLLLCGRHHLPVRIRGKLTGDIPNAGEIKEPDLSGAIRLFLEGDAAPDSPRGEVPAAPPPLPVRPPVLCAGCPHRGSFFAVKEAVRLHARGRKAVYSGDIGCYTLGNAPPLDMADTCLCMGAGISMAQGINRAEADTLNFAFIGDSTFFHTGIPGVINAVYNNADIIVVILDNFTTAMTGNQNHPGTGKTASGEPAGKISIPALLEAAGVKEIVRANPFDIRGSLETAASLLDKKGVRALVFEGACIMAGKNKGRAFFIDDEKCKRCGLCVSRLGCPAVFALPPGDGADKGPLYIDPALCNGCGVCSQVCAFSAIGETPAPPEKGGRS
jgi:indolepyruvate ferredoxin oxidoreductase alpha subunit